MGVDSVKEQLRIPLQPAQRSVKQLTPTMLKFNCILSGRLAYHAERAKMCEGMPPCISLASTVDSWKLTCPDDHISQNPETS